MPEEKQEPTHFEDVTPILRVSNLTASIDYYTQRLGFRIDWQTPVFVSVSRGRCHLFLSQGDQGHFGSWAWIGVGDAETLYAEYTASGATIRNPPTNYEWALEMQVEDPDGNILRLGSDAKKDTSIGDWLDMEGRRWSFSDGHWRAAS